MKDVVKFDLRLDSVNGKDVHREFKGSMFRDTSLTIVEIKELPSTVSIAGFKGGHTGCDIHLGHGNAIKILSRMLISAWNTGFVLESIDGGVAFNALPVKAEATIVVPSNSVDKFTAEMKTAWDIITGEVSTIESVGALSMNVVAQETLPAAPLTRISTRMAIDLWLLAPCRPIRMSPDIPDLPESSCAFTISKTFPDHIEIEGLARTSRNTQFLALKQEFQALADLVGGKMTVYDEFPGWLPLPASSLAEIAKKTHMNVLGKECRVYAVHAGLECGFVLIKYPDCQAISIGPQLENPHTTREQCEVQSIIDAFNWLKEILKELKN